MLTIDHRGRVVAVQEIVSGHSPAQLERILEHCPRDVAEAVRAYQARHSYRASQLDEVATRWRPAHRGRAFCA